MNQKLIYEWSYINHTPSLLKCPAIETNSFDNSITVTIRKLLKEKEQTNEKKTGK